MQKKLLTLTITTLMTGLLAACATAPEPSEAYKGQAPQTIYQAGRVALIDKNYGEAIKRFEALDVQYPFDAETENGQLYLIYAYYKKEDYALASAMADRFIRIHPVSPHLDYAYFMKGKSDYYTNMGVLEKFFTIDLATRDLTQVQRSFASFDQIVKLFPNSCYAPAAHQYMIYLRNVMADHELQVANYYYTRKAYVAAANRAADLVAHFQGAPATVKGLVLMVRSYHQLGLTKLEQDSLSVLQANYPNVCVDYTA